MVAKLDFLTLPLPLPSRSGSGQRQPSLQPASHPVACLFGPKWRT